MSGEKEDKDEKGLMEDDMEMKGGRKNKAKEEVEEKGGEKQEEDVDVNPEEEEKVKEEGVVWMKKTGQRRRRMEDLGEWG